MKIKINYSSKIGVFTKNDVEEEYTVEYNEKTKLKDVIKDKHHEYLNIRKYYDISLKGYLYKIEVPYLLVDNKIKWNVKTEEAKIVDIIKTHNIKNVIYVESCYPGIGGDLEFKDFIEMWNYIKPYLKMIYENKEEIYAGYKISFKAFEKIKEYFIHNKVKPQNVIEYVLTRNKWDIEELSEKMNMDKIDTENLLKFLNYREVEETGNFITEDVDFLKEKFSNIQIYIKN